MYVCMYVCVYVCIYIYIYGRGMIYIRYVMCISYVYIMCI